LVKLQNQLNAIKTIQSEWGMGVAERREKIECAVTLVQANWRSFVASKEYKRAKLDIIAIQAVARMWIASRRWKTLRLEILCAFKRFQSQGEYTLTSEGMS
jgi:myosin heavy subunit